MKTLDRLTFASPIGFITLYASAEGLTQIDFDRQENSGSDQNIHLKNAKLQLDEYFAGKRREFELEIDLQGSEFQLRTWRGLRLIPYGKTWSYKQLADKIGAVNGSRAVGMANGKNPIPIVIPCHRVIGANGTLTGYSGGLEIKKYLLNIEGHHY